MDRQNTSRLGTDATSGFWQIEMEPESRKYTAFVFEDQYAWKRMPFGMKNSSSTFQRAMEHILKPHRGYAAAYIDDITVYSDEWRKHLIDLDGVLTSIEQSGMKLRLDKCKFGRKQIRVLGQIVGNGVRKPNPEKLAALSSLKPSETRKQIQQLLGIMAYYGEYIPNMVGDTVHLSELMKNCKSRLLKLTDDALNEFNSIKTKLMNIAELTIPIFDRVTPFLIQTDASQHTVAACLAQDQGGKECQISFVSHKLSKSQINWSTIEKEAYAIIFALKKFETYLFGATVIIQTDHNPLRYITNCSSKSPRLIRWALSLQKFNILEVQHKPGKKNINCDVLSRLLKEEDEDDNNS